MKKHTFILSDESVNEYGFRILTAGIDLKRFKKNPVMLYAHIRSFESKGKDGVILPIGRWENIRKEDSQLLADAVFDEDDEFAMKISSKIDKGILNTASAGLDVLEYSEDPKLMGKGQTLPTVTKSILKEASIADIPGNGNAVRLFGKELVVSIGLSDSNPQDLNKLFLTNKPHKKMDLIISEINKYHEKTGITLSSTASEQEILVAMNKVLSNQKAELTAKTETITTLTSEKEKLTADLEAAQGNALKGKAEAVVDAALAAGKIVEAQKERYLKLASGSEEGFDFVKTELAEKKAYQPISAQLNSSGATTNDEDLAASWDKNFKDGKLEKIKLNSPDKYAEMFKAKWGREYQA
ncbi:hypothetical protein JMN32_19820 [Fulvivirga sp. 29W222]|uniref:Uncharacterized protein n=1 Tax=Fulvivirga marina TaxID=2494733 RepID=A0A937FYM7_9BACT|nr:hypothetical protein [Fulvivirga marina]MBL6448569.1 hypothetical protein [Fulvivirga marina]